MVSVLALITNTKVVKTTPSFLILEVLDNCLNNGSFYCSFKK